jgi:hypothetical protein
MRAHPPSHLFLSTWQQQGRFAPSSSVWFRLEEDSPPSSSVSFHLATTRRVRPSSSVLFRLGDNEEGSPLSLSASFHCEEDSSPSRLLGFDSATSRRAPLVRLVSPHKKVRSLVWGVPTPCPFLLTQRGYTVLVCRSYFVRNNEEANTLWSCFPFFNEEVYISFFDLVYALDSARSVVYNTATLFLLFI